MLREARAQAPRWQAFGPVPSLPIMARDAVVTLPNLVSMSRLAMAALFPFLPGTTARLVLIGAAGVTDFLDGYLARTRGSTTRIGAQIDPFADRCFILVAVCVLWADDVMTLTQMLIVAVRDVVVLGAWMIAWIVARATRQVRVFEFGPRPTGKILTVLQLFALAIAYLAPAWLATVVIGVGAVSLLAIADYSSALWRSRAAALVPLMLVVVLPAVVLPVAASAQEFRFTPTAQPEWRTGLVFSARTAALVGAAINVPAGYYVRIENAASFGRQLGAKPLDVWRAEMTARVLADPFAETRWGPYAGAGVGVDWTAGSAGRVGLMAIAGADLPSQARWRPAIEVGIGHGARISLVLRRARTAGR